MLIALRGVWRLAWCVVHLAAGLLRCALIFPWVTPEQRMRQVGRWSARMLRVLGLRIECRGVSQAGPTLVVANHISWLDILAINAVHPTRFVSKADVHHWPVLGWLVANGGTLFIERERKRDALRVVHQIAESLKQGHTIGVFPEGTTGDGASLLPFHANLLQAAIATATPVQPIAVSYQDANGPRSPVVVWVGDTTLVQSLWWVATGRELCVTVTLLPAVAATHERERRELCEQIKAQIGESLRLS